MANAPKLRNGLTIQQNDFKNKILEQVAISHKINGTQAALDTYNTTDPNTAHVIAVENLQNPTIQDAIEKALGSNGLTPQELTKNLGHYANKLSEKVSADASIKANIELLKLWGAYPGTKNTNLSLSVKANLKDLNYQDLKREVETIDQELKDIMGDEVVDSSPIVDE